MPYYYGTSSGQQQKLPSYYGSKAPYAGSVQAKQPLPPYYGSTAPYAGTVPVQPPNDPGGGGGFDTGPATRPPINFGSLDYSNDPILGRIRALAEESVAAAQADAKASRTRLVIGLGDPELAGTLKLGGDVAKQAQENTFGTLQELGRGKTRRDVFEINRPLSDQANLFYSTERGKELALSGEQYLRDRSTAQNAVQDRLAAISQQIIQAKLASQAQIIAAEQAAYDRAVQQAMYAAGAGG